MLYMQITEFKYNCFDPILPLLGEKSSKIGSGIYYYHADHLGSSSVVTDKNGKFHEHLEFFPYGETWINDRANNEDLPYRFTGKELDPETGLYFYGARYYDVKLSRWISADPPLATGEYLPSLADKIKAVKQKKEYKPEQSLPGMGGVYNAINLDAYQYCGQNPVRFVDPDGREVEIVFDLSAGTITVTDLDTGETATANAFAGGVYPNDVNYANAAGKNTGPLPLGKYEILNHPSGKVKGKVWFDLDKIDGYRDDYNAATKRGKFRLHLGTASDGCITVIDDKSSLNYHNKINIFKKPGCPNYKAWKKIEKIILNTKTSTVVDSQGRNRTKYGTVEVKP